MRRPTAAVTFLFAAVLLLGCGKKPRPADPAPDPAPEPTPDAVAPKPAPASPEPAPPDVTPPSPIPNPAPNPIPPFVAYPPAPVAPVPVAPLPAVPGAGVAQLPPPPEPFQPPDMVKKEKDKDKDKGSGSVKAEWPNQINGRSLPEYLKDTKDLDPAVRKALRTIPGFGPEIVKKDPGWAGAVLPRMNKEKEYDPGVRAAAYEAVGAVGLEKDADVTEAVRTLFLVAEQGADGGGARLHAIQTLSAFGSKAYGAINYLIGPPVKDAAYETRRSVAFTLGRIAFHEHAGPNHKALSTLLYLASDRSAPVRMEAYQSLVILGPPLAPRDPKAPLLKDVKGEAPKLDEKLVADYVAIIKKRLAPAGKAAPKANEPPSPTGLVERDKQVEIMARMVMMRFDPKEMTDENFGGVAKYCNDTETGPRLQALNVLGNMGAAGAKRMDDVVRALTAEDADVVVAAITTLVQFGPASKAAIPAVERLRTRGMTKEEREYWVDLTNRAVKAIQDTDKPPEKKP